VGRQSQNSLRGRSHGASVRVLLIESLASWDRQMEGGDMLDNIEVVLLARYIISSVALSLIPLLAMSRPILLCGYLSWIMHELRTTKITLSL
jgi:hypothetical protein